MTPVLPALSKIEMKNPFATRKLLLVDAVYHRTLYFEDLGAD